MKVFKKFAIVALSASIAMTGLTAPAHAFSSGSGGGVIQMPPISGDYYGDALTVDAIEAETLRLLNEHRVNRGLHPVVLDAALSDASRNWSNTLVRAGSLSHSNANVYENVAVHRNNPGTRGVFDLWKNSPGHNSNMLQGSVTRVGIGIAIDHKGYVWGTMQLT